MTAILWQVYLPLLGWTLLGTAGGRWMPTGWLAYIGPYPLGRFMFWVGVPLSIVGFLLETPLNLTAWVAPLFGLSAVGLGGGLAWGWVQLRGKGFCWRRGGWTAEHHAPTAIPAWSRAEEGSFQLAAMLGNTGYIGFPICLAIGGSSYFIWALLYDSIGTLFGAYGFGVWVASRHGEIQAKGSQIWLHLLRTPSLWAFVVGLGLAQTPLPHWLTSGLRGFAWAMIPVSLLLLGMRLAQVRDWSGLQKAWVALLIKLVIVPSLVGLMLALMPLPGMAKLMIVLQSGMPPAIATLVLSEEYNLDRSITVAALAAGYLMALLTLPFWVSLWG
ncbi:MAG: AEC family transporter [Cyanobacteriota bacterium]|nr:AEC family transporter [Cyanobacteriota bacterium]